MLALATDGCPVPSDRLHAARLIRIAKGKPLPSDNGCVEIGDLIQIEIAGVLQLQKAARVRAIQDYDGKKWAFIEGSKTGVPLEQVIIERKGAKVAIVPPKLPEIVQTPDIGARKEVFTLDEGDVVMTFPDNLSTASYEDLESHLQLFLRKAKRRASDIRRPVSLAFALSLFSEALRSAVPWARVTTPPTARP